MAAVEPARSQHGPKLRARKHGAAIPLDDLDKRLLNLMQGSFAITARPYAHVATQAGITERDAIDRVRHLIAPMLVLALVTLAIWSRYTRSAMLDVVHQDYMRTARAKGLYEWAILVRHGLRNAVLPLITLAGLQLPTLFGGALVTETVFTWPGMGRLFVDSLGYRDYPILMGTLMLTAVLVLAGSLLADLLYATVDPRIRLD